MCIDIFEPTYQKVFRFRSIAVSRCLKVFQVFQGTGTLTKREARLTERACERLTECEARLTFKLVFQVFQVFHGTGTLTKREARLTERACERLTECEARLTERACERLTECEARLTFKWISPISL